MLTGSIRADRGSCPLAIMGALVVITEAMDWVAPAPGAVGSPRGFPMTRLLETI